MKIRIPTTEQSELHADIVTHIVHVPRRSVLPAEVDEGVVGLLDVDLTFALVGGHRAALHGHLTCTKLHQVLAGGTTGPRHQAGEQSSRGHDDPDGLRRKINEGAGAKNDINLELIHLRTSVGANIDHI